MYHARKGFTLVELMVALTIIGLLTALFFPVFISARERANKTDCISNLRQIGQAVAMYQADSGEETPPYAPYLLLPYLGNDCRVLQCPNAPAYMQPQKKGAQWESYGWDYWTAPFDNVWGTWKAALAQRGSSFPIAACGFHDFQPANLPPGSTHFNLILRLDGSVTGRRVSYSETPWKN